MCICKYTQYILKIFTCIYLYSYTLYYINIFNIFGVEKHCTRASLHSDTVEDLIRISVEGQVWKMLMLERECGQLV